jgi:hypothetical protein
VKLYTKIVTTLLVALALVILALALLGLRLPTHASAQRSIMIEAPRPTVFALVDSVARRAEWSPWLDIESDPTVILEGPAMGVGSRLTWGGGASGAGAGSAEIVDSEPHESVTARLDFAGRGSATSTVTLQADGDSTRATWRLDTDLGKGIVSRYFGLAFDSVTGPSLERGLTDLKALAEALPNTEP